MRADVGGWRSGLGLRAVGSTLLGLSFLPLAGCSGFFVCQNKPACPTSTGTGTGTGTGSAVDFAFVAYTTTAGSSLITGYNLAGGALAAINTVTLPFVPVAMAVNPKNSLLYVASVPGASSPGVYAYSIGADGTLSAASGGTALAGDQVAAMTISPDGNFLYTVELANETTTQWTINPTTGGLTASGALPAPVLSCAPAVSTPVLPSCSVAVSPKGDFLMTSLGTAGDAVFRYASTGVPSTTAVTTIAAGTNSGDFSVAIDASDNAYVAQTSTLTVYTLSSSGVTVQGTAFAYPSGSNPRSVVVDPSSKYVYTADVGTGKISGFATGTGGVTELAGSPFAAPAQVAALGVDSTDTYLVAVGYDAAAGVQLYSVASSGVLSALAKTAATSTVTQDPVLVAMSH